MWLKCVRAEIAKRFSIGPLFPLYQSCCRVLSSPCTCLDGEAKKKKKKKKRGCTNEITRKDWQDVGAKELMK